MTMLNVRIPDSLAGRLGALANQTGRTKSYYIRQALEDKLSELEAYYLAMESLEKVETGKSRLWSHDDIEAGRDLED